jgi:hypothetical protein
MHDLGKDGLALIHLDPLSGRRVPGEEGTS